MMNDNYYMELALKEARKAYKKKEIPVGCVIVLGDKIISRGYNKREGKQNALLHAEIIAINKACKKLHSWRLDNCRIYVTLEPCIMCTGAIIQSKITNIYYGATDNKTGACGGFIDLFLNKYNCTFNVTKGIMEKECSQIIKDFFRGLREDVKKK